MPETDVVAKPSAFQKRTKPPPLVYWSEVKTPRPSKYVSTPIQADRERGSLWNGRVLLPHPDSARGKGLAVVAVKKKKYNQRANLKKVRQLDPICRYCMEAPSTTADHVRPKSRGGSNRLVNLVGCCLPCNWRKGSMTPKEAGMKLHLPLRFFSYPKEAPRG